MGHFFSRGNNNNGNNFDPLNDNVLRLRQRNLNDNDNTSNNAHTGARSFYVIFGKPSIRYRRERTRGPLIFNVRRNVHINDMDEVVDESSLGALDAIQHARSVELECAISNKQHFELVYSPNPQSININNDKDKESKSTLTDYFNLHFQLSLNKPLERLIVCANVAVTYEDGSGIHLQGHWRKPKHTNKYKHNYGNAKDEVPQFQLKSNSKIRPLFNRRESHMMSERQNRKMYCLYDEYHITEDEVNVQIPARVLANISKATFSSSSSHSSSRHLMFISRSVRNNNNNNDDSDEESNSSSNSSRSRSRSSESHNANGVERFESHHSINNTLRHVISNDNTSDQTQSTNPISLTQKKRITSAPFVIVSYIHINGPKPKIIKKLPKVKRKAERSTSQIRVGTSVEERKDIFCLKIKSTSREEVKTKEHSESEDEGITTFREQHEELEEEETVLEDEEKENQILFTFLDFNVKDLKHNLSHQHHLQTRELSSHTIHVNESNTRHVKSKSNERMKRTQSSHSQMSSNANVAESHSVDGVHGSLTDSISVDNNNSNNIMMLPQRSTLSSSSRTSASRKFKLNVVAQLLQVGTEVYLLEDVFDLGVTEKNEDNEDGEDDMNNTNNNNSDNRNGNASEKEKSNKNKERNEGNDSLHHNNHASIFDVEQNDDDDEDHDVCVICLSNPNNTTLLPCRHKCVCHACAAQLKLTNNRCPICRAKIERTMTL